MNFYLCSTPYHLLISLCMIYNNNQKSFIYLSTPDDNVFRLFRKYESEIKKIRNIEKVYLRKRDNFKERFLIENLKDKKELKKIQNYLDDSTVYIFPWHSYGLFSPAEYIFKKSKKVILVEDGANAYLKPKPSKLEQLIKKYLYKRDLEFFYKSKVECILVQYPEKYPNFLTKVKKLDLEMYFGNLEEDRKLEIANVFDSNLSTSMFKDNPVIVLTQPLSEDKYIEEQEKVSIYKDIIEKYCKGHEVIIKKHPREKTIYKFKDVKEIEGDFPSEIFCLLNIKFEKAIGICTSAVKFINANEKFNIDEQFLNKLKDRQGDE